MEEMILRRTQNNNSQKTTKIKKYLSNNNHFKCQLTKTPIKRHRCWIDLESEVAERVTYRVKVTDKSERDKTHRILRHICGIYKNGINDLGCKLEINSQTQRTNEQMPRGKGVGWKELGDWD